MKKFSFLNQFPDGVIVTNKSGDVVFQNNAFKRMFKNFSGLKKFSHNMNFDICPLNSENIEIYSPVYHALNSKEDFFSRITYQVSPTAAKYFDLTAIKRSRKVSGKCLGKLTPLGLVPTQRRLVKESDQRPARVSDVAEAGAVLFFWVRTVSMRERLKEFFPDIWQTIYAAAILRAIKEPRFRRLRRSCG